MGATIVAMVGTRASSSSEVWLSEEDRGLCRRGACDRVRVRARDLSSRGLAVPLRWLRAQR